MQSSKDSNVVAPVDGKGDGGNKLSDGDPKNCKNEEPEDEVPGIPESVEWEVVEAIETINDPKPSLNASEKKESPEDESAEVTVTRFPESVNLEVEITPDTVSDPKPSLSPSEKKEILLDSDELDSMVDNTRIIKQIINLTTANIKLSYIPPKIEVEGRKEYAKLAYELLNKLLATIKNQRKVVEDLDLPIYYSPSASGIGSLHSEELISNSSDGCLEVYVSEVESPNKFWVHIRSTRDQLFDLLDEMTLFYEGELQSPKNKKSLQVNSISPGDIVAASGDDCWYRAQVYNVSNENDQKKISVFFLDFGYIDEILSQDLVCILNPKFFSLPFQAIECCLAFVKPIMNGEWSNEAIEAFKNISDVNQSDLSKKKVMKAKPIKKLPVNEENVLQKTVNFVQLFDLNKDIDDELRDIGYGKYVYEYSEE